MLDFDIYGLKARVNFINRNDEKEVAGLLKFFLIEHIEKVEVDLDFIKEEAVQEIGGLFLPLSCRNRHMGNAFRWISL